MDRITRILYKELYRRSLHDFVKDFWHTCDPSKFIDGQLIEYYCEVFEYFCRKWTGEKPVEEVDLSFVEKDDLIVDIRQGDKQNLCINMPPRHTKTMIFDVMGPVWLWLSYPIKAISISHTNGLSTEVNSKRHKLINSEEFNEIFGEEIRLTSNSIGYLNDTRGGELRSLNRNNLTGYGGDLIINDDLTNAEAARKDKAEMLNAWEYYKNTMPSRINDISNYIGGRNEHTEKVRKVLERSEELKKQYSNFTGELSSAQVKELEKNIQDLTAVLPNLGKNLDSTTGVLERWSKIVNEASEGVSNMENTTKRTAKALADNWVVNNLDSEYQEKLAEIDNQQTSQQLNTINEMGGTVSEFRGWINEYGAQGAYDAFDKKIVDEMLRESPGYDTGSDSSLLLRFLGQIGTQASINPNKYGAAYPAVYSMAETALRMNTSDKYILPYTNTDEFFTDVENGMPAFSEANKDMPGSPMISFAEYLNSQFGYGGERADSLELQRDALVNALVESVIKEAAGVYSTWISGTDSS